MSNKTELKVLVCSGMNEQVVTVVVEKPGERLDKAVADAISELSRSQIQQLIREGRVLLGGEPVKANHRLARREVVSIILREPQNPHLTAEMIPLDVRYEDGDIIAINKPSGMVVHPSAGHDSGTLVNAILGSWPDLEGVGGERRPGIVHRLDRDTSGLILVAKNDRSLRHLQRQFKSRKVSKLYKALVEGRVAHSHFLIDAPIGRDPRDRKRMAVIPPGSSDKAREAQTRVTVDRHFPGQTLVSCEPITGRTHQIRVHLAFTGHPIVGDPIYGRRRKETGLRRLFLHAAAITFGRPSDNKQLTLHAELPEDLQAYLTSLQP